MFYECLMVITKQKSLVESQTLRKGTQQHGKAPIYKGRHRGEKETMELQNNQKAINKMSVISPYISKLTLNVNGLNSQIKAIEWLAG